MRKDAQSRREGLLDALPVIGAALKRQWLAERMDEVVPRDPRHNVTAGDFRGGPFFDSFLFHRSRRPAFARTR
jgi:hypothetical protein